MNVTRAIDARVVAEARRIAAVRKPASTSEAESAVAQLDALWADEDFRSASSWTREELRERSPLRHPFES